MRRRWLLALLFQGTRRLLPLPLPLAIPVRMWRGVVWGRRWGGGRMPKSDPVKKLAARPNSGSAHHPTAVVTCLCNYLLNLLNLVVLKLKSSMRTPSLVPFSHLLLLSKYTHCNVVALPFGIGLDARIAVVKNRTAARTPYIYHI